MAEIRLLAVPWQMDHHAELRKSFRYNSLQFALLELDLGRLILGEMEEIES